MAGSRQPDGQAHPQGEAGGRGALGRRSRPARASRSPRSKATARPPSTSVSSAWGATSRRSWGSWPTWCPSGGARTSTPSASASTSTTPTCSWPRPTNGALFSLQSSYVTVGNYPGIEARIFGSEGAIKVRLVEEFGVIQTIHTAKPGRGGVRAARDPREVLPPRLPDGRRLERGLLRQPRPQLLRRRSARAATRTRATSPRARGCRRSSTR